MHSLLTSLVQESQVGSNYNVPVDKIKCIENLVKEAQRSSFIPVALLRLSMTEVSVP